ncbi:Uncharacterized protein HZ326_18180 [Fusarium oxysporum f. sp. albedinis]|nr:Uncharacterized protein HZ326_18180 [Fusarium oxysporum f. sp. albedinis]
MPYAYRHQRTFTLVQCWVAVKRGIQATLESSPTSLHAERCLPSSHALTHELASIKLSSPSRPLRHDYADTSNKVALILHLLKTYKARVSETRVVILEYALRGYTSQPVSHLALTTVSNLS